MFAKAPAKVLVVEDEPSVAMALRVAVAKRFPGVELEVVGDGTTASERIAAERYRLILCDWNLPGKNGDQLLRELRERERETGEGASTPFLMLTARSDRASVVKALQAGVTDYLTKPFEREGLLAKLAPLVGEIDPMAAAAAQVEMARREREAARAGETPAWDPLEVIDRITVLLKSGKVEFPALPEVAVKVSELCRAEEPDVEALVKAIQVDPGVSSKLIGVSNSAMYRASQPNKTLEEAVIRLGLKRTHNVVMMSSTGKLFKNDSPTISELLTALWEHSIAVATCAKLVGQRLKVSQPEVLFTMGLLHDIGKLVLLLLIQSEFQGMQREALERVLGALHAPAGAALLREWNFPIEIVEGAAFHHDIGNGSFSLMLRILGFANLYVRRLGFSLVDSDDEEPAAMAGRCGVKIEAELLESLDEAVKGAVAELREAL